MVFLPAGNGESQILRVRAARSLAAKTDHLAHNSATSLPIVRRPLKTHDQVSRAVERVVSSCRFRRTDKGSRCDGETMSSQDLSRAIAGSRLIVEHQLPTVFKQSDSFMRALLDLNGTHRSS